jgi:hypothetical protein
MGGAVWKLFLVCLSCTAALILGSALLGRPPGPVEKGIEWVKSLDSREPDPVLVLLVADRSGVAAVRAAVEPTRILAETPDALVLREGRVVATSPEVVGGPLGDAGFADRSIELWAPTRGDRQKREKGEDEGLSLSALAKKPTLTPLEALAILSGAVPGVGI